LKNTLVEISEKINFNSKQIKSENILKLVKEILTVKSADNMVFLYGAGRSGFIGRCFVQRLMHLGIKSCFISDAITHQYTKDDLLILISGSGETTSTVAIALNAKEIGGKIILLTANSLSSIARISHLIIEILGKTKDKALLENTYAPYTTLFDISALTILDSIAGVLMKILGVTEGDINKRHASIE